MADKTVTLKVNWNAGRLEFKAAVSGRTYVYNPATDLGLLKNVDERDLPQLLKLSYSQGDEAAGQRKFYFSK